MSYASQKGYKGEREVAEFLTNVFKQWGFKFMRIGGTEKNKKIFAGDVVLDYRTDKEQNCVLRDYYIEVKKQGKPNVFADYEKAKDDAEYWNKKGAIMFVIKSEKGKFDNKKIVVLDWQLFAQFIKDLQYYYDPNK